MFYNDSNELVTIEELCNILLIGRNTAYTLLNSGQIKAFKIGRIWKISRQAVNEYIMTQSKLEKKIPKH